MGNIVVIIVVTVNYTQRASTKWGQRKSAFISIQSDFEWHEFGVKQWSSLGIGGVPEARCFSEAGWSRREWRTRSGRRSKHHSCDVSIMMNSNEYLRLREREKWKVLSSGSLFHLDFR